MFFLPPYSQDLIPIEQMFSKLKRLLRKANERTVEATWRRIGQLLDAFPPDECQNYIRHAGYASISVRKTLENELHTRICVAIGGTAGEIAAAR
jgi:transposase